MKTQYELTYEKAITAMILSDNNPNHNQLELFMEFHRNSCTYYDIFCDSLFFLSSGQSTDKLWLTPSGKPYLSSDHRSEDDHRLLTSEQLPEFEDDLKDQLETALTLMQGLSSMQSTVRTSSC